MLFSESLFQVFINILPRNSHVLDVCCGTDSLGVIKRLINSKFQVTAIDFSEKTLALFTENIKTNLPEFQYIRNVNYCVQDVRALGLQSQSFDGLTAIYALDYFQTREYFMLFQAFAKVLKSYGLFLLSFTFDPKSEQIDFDLFFPVLLNDLTNAGYGIVDMKSEIYSPYHWILTKKCD